MHIEANRIITSGLVVIACAALAYSVLADGTVSSDDIGRLAVATLILTVVWRLTTKRRCDEEAIWGAGHDAGYQRGWDDCRMELVPPVRLLRIAERDATWMASSEN